MIYLKPQTELLSGPSPQTSSAAASGEEVEIRRPHDFQVRDTQCQKKVGE